MIPTLTHGGVLPPFYPGAAPSSAGGRAPYKAQLLEFAQRFATTTARAQVLRGLISYRQRLLSVGIDTGFQWLDGSFVEDCESLRGRPPKDIDIVTFALRPSSHTDAASWRTLFNANRDLFDPKITKATYQCDAYYVDLNLHPVGVVARTSYFFGLFSHQRDTHLWKGLVEVPLASDDSSVGQFLQQVIGNAS